MWKSVKSALHWNVDADNVSLPLSMSSTSDVGKPDVFPRITLLRASWESRRELSIATTVLGHQTVELP